MSPAKLTTLVLRWAICLGCMATAAGGLVYPLHADGGTNAVADIKAGANPDLFPQTNAYDKTIVAQNDRLLSLGSLEKHMDATLRVIGLFQIQEPSMTDMNPDNMVYKLPRYTPSLGFRPEISANLDTPDLYGKIRPRYLLQKYYYEDGVLAGETGRDDSFDITRYMVRLRINTPSLQLSAFRDNYQWGPAYIGTPSNPFFTDNILKYPFEEAPGTDFASVTWTPYNALSMCYMYNYSEGYGVPTDPGAMYEFHKTHAIKTDFYLSESCFSLIGAVKDQDHNMVGSFGQWTVADAWLLYYDSAFRQGASAYYPVADTSSPVGGELKQTKDDDTSIEPEILVGATYTTPDNTTLYLEYLFYDPGYSTSEQDDLSEIAVQSSNVIRNDPQSPYVELALANLGHAYFNGLRWQSKHELMFQITKDISNLSLVSHNVLSPVNFSGYVFGSAVYSINNHKFMLSGMQNFGPWDGEYRQELNYQVVLGYMFQI